VRSRQLEALESELMLGHDIHHRTLGILAWAALGQAMARRAAAFPLRVLYHKRTRLTPDLRTTSRGLGSQRKNYCESRISSAFMFR